MSFRQGENSVLRAPAGDFVPLDRVAYEGTGGRCVGRVMEVSDDGVVIVEVLTLNERPMVSKPHQRISVSRLVRV